VSVASTGFPPRRRLAQVLRSLARHLPGQLEQLLTHPRFAEDAKALARFADPAHLEAAVAALSGDEASWLAASLLERWGRLADPRLDPEVAIVVLDEVWVGHEPVRVPVGLETLGLDPDWEAIWEGDVPPGPPATSVVLVARPPAGREATLLRVRARVRGRAGGERCVLLASASVRVRQPVVVVKDDRRRVLVCDQEERPAAGVRLEVGDAAYVTGANGLVELPQPAPPGAALRVEGIPAGRVPGA
jgi:hypothetical protein